MIAQDLVPALQPRDRYDHMDGWGWRQHTNHSSTYGEQGQPSRTDPSPQHSR